ncbi:hypothetical protein H6B14_00220 [Phocaeicola coprophilus]|nr:hypothetical protein [Phocaeicola coprophilus]
MKRLFPLFIIDLLFSVVMLSSCTNDDNAVTPAEPGVYTIDMAVDAQRETSKSTRGIENNSNFDVNYDPDTIYLHQKDGNGVLAFPLYSYTNSEGQQCNKGFRYRIEVKEDGSATITPIDSTYNYLETSLELSSGAEVYFSSLESDDWTLPDEQITDSGDYTLYLRKNDINKEIYRSAADFSITDLTTSGPVVIHRACAAFNLVGLFYDGEELGSLDEEEGGYASLTDDKFTEIMGSDPSTWYIKIITGGPAFTNQYDLSSQQSTGDREGGYYSSGDSDLFEQGSEDANKYLPLTNRNYNYSPDIMLQGFGYYTRTGNQLFTPVTGGEAHVYIRIKHWTGSGEPTDEWLLDDTGALQTEVDMGGTTVPANNSFHIYGLLMDIRQFQSAWESAGGDAAANATRSTGGVRTFTLKDAKVVCETF